MLRKYFMIFVYTSLFISLGALDSLAQIRPKVIYEETIKQVRQEVKQSATTRDNLNERYRVLGGWINRLRNEGVNIDMAFTRQDITALKEAIREKDYRSACLRIDTMFAKLEELVTGRQPEKNVPSQTKILHRKVYFPVNSSKVKIIKALPDAERGIQIKEKPEFICVTADAVKGVVMLNISKEPTWIIEKDLPKKKNLSIEHSPFGFHPASVGADYRYGKEIGVAWDRGGMYFMWTIGQPDIKKEEYNWEIYDGYFIKLSEGMRTLKNICISMAPPPSQDDTKVKKSGNNLRINPEREKEARRRHLYFKGNSFHPSDPEAYARWVKAVIERYDGDGKDDMPGLHIPAKHWQVDNEPYIYAREGFADLVSITSKAIKNADPDAKVLQGGMIMPPLLKYKNSVKELFGKFEDIWFPMFQKLNGEYIDIIDLHWFGEFGEWKILPEYLNVLRSYLQNCGFKHTPIWMTEMGMPSKLGKEREQASEMVKRYVVAIGEGVEKIFWAWGMMEGFGEPRDNDFFDNTGFIYDGIGPDDSGRGTKKISYWAYQNMTQLLQYWDGSLPERINADHGVVAYRFRFDKNEDCGIVAVWLDEEISKIGDSTLFKIGVK